ncbi:hypothetical protein IVB05_30610 [Bradyrhizobium sp. 170]|nr:hypothetical protein IVB05_30610 [Bradyrhizobium sp. 170]
MRHGQEETRASRNHGVFRTGRRALPSSVGAVTGDQCGRRREILCGAFLMGDLGTSGVTVGLSCRSGSTDVIWLQASHL